jgi:hypothetical protein
LLPEALCPCATAGTGDKTITADMHSTITRELRLIFSPWWVHGGVQNAEDLKHPGNPYGRIFQTTSWLVSMMDVPPVKNRILRTHFPARMEGVSGSV